MGLSYVDYVVKNSFFCHPKLSKLVRPKLASKAKIKLFNAKVQKRRREKEGFKLATLSNLCQLFMFQSNMIDKKYNYQISL